jgi:hypothetical protein
MIYPVAGGGLIVAENVNFLHNLIIPANTYAYTTRGYNLHHLCKLTLTCQWLASSADHHLWSTSAKKFN